MHHNKGKEVEKMKEEEKKQSMATLKEKENEKNNLCYFLMLWEDGFIHLSELTLWIS